MSFKNLINIVPPPVAPIETGQAEGWSAIEQELGIHLPNDYRDYVMAFGSGYLNEFIWIFNPFAKTNSVNLTKQIQIRLNALREIKTQFPQDVPFSLFPEKEGVLPCGATGNGDCIYWLTKGNPDEWPILVNESRGPDWAKYEVGLTDFLAGVLKRKIVCNIFPSDFPSEKITFAPRS